MAKRVLKRAAQCAALFVFLAGPVLLVTAIAASDAFARMREGKLVIELAAGGAGRPIDIEIAETEEEKALGLMFRTSLADDHGMLFFYGDGRELTMWMRNTYISLDMVFIRADGVIHRIEVKAEPLSDRVISSGAPVAAVLELAGGAADRFGIKPGDTVRHALFGKPGAPAQSAPKVEAPATAPPGY